MKILHVVNLGYKAGGAEASVFMLRNQQRENGHEVRVLSTDTQGPDMFSDYEVPAIKSTGFLRVFAYVFYPAAYKILKQIMAEYQPDIIHFHTVALFSPSILFASRGTESVLTIHGPEPFIYKLLPWSLRVQDYKDRSYDLGALTKIGILHYIYFKYIIRPVYLLALKNVSYLVAPSHYMAGVIENDVSRSKIIQIYNGILLPAATPLKRYDTVLYVGRLEEAKGVHILLKAFAEARSHLPSTALLRIVGDGEYRTVLERQSLELGLLDCVIFDGWLRSTEEINATYEDSSVVVVPSIWPENLGSVCIEAMAVGRAIIGSNTGGIPELVDDGHTGYLVPIGDTHAISRKLIELLGNEKLLERFSENAGKKALEFNIKNFNEKIENTYKQALKNRIPSH